MFLGKLKFKRNSGFTLTEAMVTIGIIAIMSAVYLINYRPTNQKIILDQAAAGIVADLRYAQNMAMNVKKFGDEVPVGGYGVNIGSPLPVTSYTIFADVDAGYDKRYSGPSEKFAERMLAGGISIVSTNSFSDIDFEPPFPTVWIDGDETASSAVIILRYGAEGGPEKTITLNRLTGQISVN